MSGLYYLVTHCMDRLTECLTVSVFSPESDKTDDMKLTETIEKSYLTIYKTYYDI